MEFWNSSLNSCPNSTNTHNSKIKLLKENKQETTTINMQINCNIYLRQRDTTSNVSLDNPLVA